MFGSGVFMCFLFFSYLRGSAATYLSNVFNAFRLTIVGSTTNNLGCTTNNLEGSRMEQEKQLKGLATVWPEEEGQAPANRLFSTA